MPLREASARKMDVVLQNFFAELKKKNGTDYKPECLENNCEKQGIPNSNIAAAITGHRSVQIEFAAVCGDGAGEPCTDKQGVKQ